MNCKYCGAALPTRGGTCPNCGKMIPFDQKREMKQILDPKWNNYRNQNTALYKSASNEGKKNNNYLILLIVVVVLVIILMIIL